MRTFLLVATAVGLMSEFGGVRAANAQSQTTSTYQWVKQPVICPSTGHVLSTKRVRVLVSTKPSG